MKKELIEKKKELEKKLIEINEEINLEILRDDLKELQIITDQLNTLFQSKIVGKYGYSIWSSEKAPVFIFNAMQILYNSHAQLGQEIEGIEVELNYKNNSDGK
jgi:hypothetical protein